MQAGKRLIMAAMMLSLWGGVVSGRQAPDAATAALLARLGPSDLQSVHIRGAPLAIYGSPETGFVVVYRGQAFVLDKDDARAGIRTVVSGSGKTYVIVAENAGGASTLDTFRILDVSTNKLIAAPQTVGYAEGDAGWHVLPDGTLDASFPKPDGTGREEITYLDGVVTSRDHLDAVAPSGPDAPPGGDYVAMLNGKDLSFAFKSRALEPKLRALLPTAIYADARAMALAGVDDSFHPIGADGTEVLGRVCEAHNCYAHSIAVIVTSDGKAFARYQPDGGKPVVYGSPDQAQLSFLGRG